MTRHEANVMTAYTGIFMTEFDSFHQYVEKILKRPVFTHELGYKEIAEDIKEASKADFLEICKGVA